MPRVRDNAGANAGTTASPTKPLQIPLNDDRQEKAARLHSRQQAQTLQRETYKNAVLSPSSRKRKSLGQSSNNDSNDPSTPSQPPLSADPDFHVSGSAVTPMKRVPLLANFEEWMKMATDNKINAGNSWNFALIDYFHDMSLLREGDGVNFQKASCTLDGCVKIYTSRVDSVATETGKLLSGLAESKSRRTKAGGEEAGEDGEDDGEGEEGEEAGKRKAKRKAARSAEATLVGSFEQLRLKKMEWEFAVDPLFKKASADFDEGGAKGLLLNHLSIDNTGRIVFDSSDDVQDDGAEDVSRRDSLDPEGVQSETKPSVPDSAAEDNAPIDIASLATRFFPDLTILSTQDICPSLKTFELGAGDSALELPFLKAPENWRDDHPETSSSDPAAGDEQTALFNDDNGEAPLYNDYDNDDEPAGAGFGEGGEVWARNAHLNAQIQPHLTSDSNSDEAQTNGGFGSGGEIGTFDAESNSYGVTLTNTSTAQDQENILTYFDTALSRNWAGPEHWKIARIKAAQLQSSLPKEPRAKKEKEPFEIDFFAPMTKDLAALLYTPATNPGSICLPKRERRSRGRNLLPDDKHFSSRDLLHLFLKPRARIGARLRGGASRAPLREVGGRAGEVDEHFWASDDAAALNGSGTGPGAEVVEGRGDYDADFFQDDQLPPLHSGGGGEDDDDFADARDHFSPGADEVDAGGAAGVGIDGVIAAASQDSAGGVDGGLGVEGGAFGANLVAQSRRLRPEYVQYARAAKKVDVRRLKEEMWRGMDMRFDPPQTPSQFPATADSDIPTTRKEDAVTRNFVDIMNNLQHVYPRQQMADISTSYGFICLLHLANEKGLVIENVEGWGDLTVRRDVGAVVGGEGGE